MILSWHAWHPWHPGKVLSLLAVVWLLLVTSGGVEHGACGGAAEARGGALVGKLEGPETVTDSQTPTRRCPSSWPARARSWVTPRKAGPAWAALRRLTT
jgi:hypothetical protein